jgi:putative lipoprotein
MRSIKGQIVVPADAPKRKAHTISIEVHDISVADAPSKMLSQSRLTNAQVKPNGHLAFQIDVPETTSRMLAFRVHVDWDGDGKISTGDLLTTQVIPVPPSAEPAQVKVPVTLI